MVDEVTLSPESIEALARALRGTDSNRPSPASGGGSTSSGTDFGSALRGAGETASGFGAVLGNAGGRVSDFANTVVGAVTPTRFFGNLIGDLNGYIDNTNAVFQSLSKVGGGFNGDLGALRSAAASTRMPLDQFANLVGRNAQALAGLGTGVNDGTRRFAELSRAMFEDGQVIRGMTNLGYTLEEANEFLLDNSTLLRRQQMLDGMSDQQVAQATLRMAENIAFMAEITGESAEQQRQELIDAQRDGRNIAALRLLEAQGLEGVQESFDTAFTGLQAAGPAAQAFLQDMIQSGAPMSELTQNFAAMNPQVAAQIRQMAATIKSNEDAETKRQRVQAQANRAVETSASEYVSSTNLATAALGQISGVGQSQADLIAETENYRVGVEQMRRRMAMERGFESGFGDVTMQEASDRFMQETRDRVTAQTAGGAEGQALSRELNMATIAIADSVAGVNQEIGRNLSANTELQRVATEGLRGLADTAISLGQGAEALVRSGSPGSVEQDVVDANNFRSLFEPIITTNGLRTEITNLGEVLEVLGFDPDERVEMLEAARAAREAREANTDGERALGGPVAAGARYLVGEEGPETFVPGASGVILPNMQSEMAAVQRAMETIMPAMRSEAGTMQSSLMQMANNASQSILPMMREEASAMQGNLMQLANNASQSILPMMREEVSSMQSSLMQMANNLRSRFEESNRTGGTIDPTSILDELRGAMTNSPDISTQRMEQLLDTLNQSMMQLVSINNNMSRNGQRTVEALRGASGNLLQGVRSR